MVDFLFKRSFFLIKEMAFGSYDDTSKSNCDVVYMHSNDSENLSNKSIFCFAERQYTLVNDLTISEDDLWMLFRKTYRNEIRRVENNESIISFYDNNSKDIDSIIDAFEKTYNDMFDSKNMSNRFNRRIVESGIDSGQIVISVCKIPETQFSIYHAYLFDGIRTVLMYSASPLWDGIEKETTTQIGRLNKFLHWKDMLYFKNIGCSVYEWGGINDVEKPNGIAKFKMGFGGNVSVFYNYTVARSILGVPYVYLVKRKSNHG